MEIIPQKFLLKISKYCLLLLAFFLPLHGAITVFFPDNFRFWKEIVILVLFIVIFVIELKMWWKHEWPRNLITPWLAFGFIFWLIFLVTVDPDPLTAGFSARYLGLGFLIFLFVARLFQNVKAKEKKEWLGQFSLAVVISCVISFLFGFWAKFLGGFEILSSFYSTTISSWVPGQTIPLYHEIEGVARMQGMSSGAIEFAHMLVVGLFMTLFIKGPKWLKIVLSLVFFFGILQSESRAIFAVALTGTLYFILQYFGVKAKKIVTIFGVIFIIGIGTIFLSSSLNNKIVQRTGTMDHINRPIEAVQMAMKEPLLGHLGEVGPSARSKNLKEKNNDYAFIAENVFADYFLQLGIIGLVFGLGFFITLFFESEMMGKLFIVGGFLLANMATIFDMTPISILFFLVFAFFFRRKS